MNSRVYDITKSSVNTHLCLTLIYCFKEVNCFIHVHYKLNLLLKDNSYLPVMMFIDDAVIQMQIWGPNLIGRGHCNATA